MTISRVRGAVNGKGRVKDHGYLIIIIIARHLNDREIPTLPPNNERWGNPIITSDGRSHTSFPVTLTIYRCYITRLESRMYDPDALLV